MSFQSHNTYPKEFPRCDIKGCNQEADIYDNCDLCSDIENTPQHHKACFSCYNEPGYFDTIHEVIDV